jgi:hypothetical protein
MSPTTTAGLPPVMAWASGVWICRMSHCRAARLSSVAGAFGRSPGDVSGTSTFATARETATVSIPAPPFIACANVGELDRAITTPISP